MVPFGPVAGLNVLSTLPSPFSRAMRLRVVPLKVVNAPPTSTLLSGCTATDLTGSVHQEQLAPGGTDRRQPELGGIGEAGDSVTIGRTGCAAAAKNSRTESQVNFIYHPCAKKCVIEFSASFT